jgi:hypothetical protein
VQANQRPALVNKAVEDHKLVSSDVLGKTRKLGAGSCSLPKDFTFGMPTTGKVRGSLAVCSDEIQKAS